MNKPAKLEMGDLLYFGLVIMLLGIILSFGADVQDDLRTDFVTNTVGCNSTDKSACDWNYNISTKGLEGSYNLTKKVPTIGTVAAIVVVIGLLITGFGAYMQQR